MKKIGNREEVFKGIAEKTSGGLKKEDLKEKKIGKKMKYISRKKSMKMKKENPFQNKNKNKKVKKNNKSIKKKKKEKILFNLEDNKVQEYYCKEMDDDEMFDTTLFNQNQNQNNDDFEIKNIDDLNLDNL